MVVGEKNQNITTAVKINLFVFVIFLKMSEVKLDRRERRRRRADYHKTIENGEFSINPHVTQSLKKLVRRDTYTVSSTKSNLAVNVQQDVSSEDSNESSRNLTYSLNKSSTNTYSIGESQDKVRPVPAPRRWKSITLEQEKQSSDTDRDITEIDLDVKSPQHKETEFEFPAQINKPTQDNLIPPVPKPRKTLQNISKIELESKNTNNQILKPSSESCSSKIEEFDEKIVNSDESEEKSQDGEEPPKSNELPIVTSLRESEKSNKKSQIFLALLDRNSQKKKTKSFSSLIKLEKKKIPKITSILKDLKEEKPKPDVEIDKTEIQIESPHYVESVENERIYVQSKNGFFIMEKDAVLKTGNENTEVDENGGMIEDSTVKSAIIFQKYWSRSMTYFHGVLAGFGFSHAATVTAIMLHFHYEPSGFINVYSCLSLKIHYVFYTLTALCIVSCFDRIDIGHMNQNHWQIAWKIPSMWIILLIYIISFILTFSNQTTEAKFDAFPNSNITDLWPSDSHVSLLQWYHTVWTRDVLVLFAWLMISLTSFNDFLFSHIKNMAKYADIKEEDRNFRQKTNFL